MNSTDLPILEIDLLTNTVDEALSLAHEGRWHRGYLELLYGLERARAAAEEEWGPGLAFRWARALSEYTKGHLPPN